MKKQVRCLNCNARLFDIEDEENVHGNVTIKCRRCATMSIIKLESL
jgi:phage FluMu protein Com